MASRKSRRRDFKSRSDIFKKPQRGLHEILEENDLHKIHSAFQNADGKFLDRKQLRELLQDVAKFTLEDKEFEVLFLKINSGRNGLITWDEFISYLILCFQQIDIIAEYQSLEMPIEGVPRVLKSNHRHPVCRIAYYPTVKPDRTTTWKDGSIVTCSKDGIINYWSLDLQIERTVQSTCPELKIQQTWITDLCVMPDVSVICTSSTERDLRFYDTSARKFELRVMFSSLDHAVCTMHYVFSKNVEEDSFLITGDMGGNIKVILFSSIGRGPFKSQPGIPLLHVRYDRVSKGLVDGFKAIEFKNVHTDWVRQVSYYSALQCLVSCSDCIRTPLIMKDLSESRINSAFKLQRGIWCFALGEGVHAVATGGPDCLVRVWNPFVPRRATVTFLGHHAGIVALVFQDKGAKLASLSKDKCIKVWDVTAQVCLQTYLGLPAELGERTALTLLYNAESREMIIGSSCLAVVHLCRLQSSEHTDGNTHSSGVSVVLYNSLFKVIATCGLDSYIIIWDPWNGRRMNVIKEAHTRLLHGEIIPVEITAATFDPDNQMLLTGAHDGSLKIWNFNTGTCYRNMKIEKGCEVTSIIWIKGRILATGWNRHITEFNDTGVALGPGGSFSKSWDTRHDEDILSAAVRVPQTLVTSTFNGELIMWQLETGQAYKRFNVASPTIRIKLEYRVQGKKKGRQEGPGGTHPVPDITSTGKTKAPPGFAKRQSLSFKKAKTAEPAAPLKQPKFLTPQARARKVSMVVIPETCIPLRGLAVHTMIFLPTRPMRPDCGTLLVALENGTVQMWSHHVAGGFITSFSAIHKAGDYVISMIADSQDEFLFTGTSVGYIKIWLMKDYCTHEPVEICMPKYRLMFPFLWKDTFVGRAKRMNRGQPKPLLLSCIKAHLMPVSGLTYLEEAKIIVSCSADSSARMWSLSGRYIQTIGTFKPWKNLDVDLEPPEDFPYTIPPDIRRVASSTSFRVLNGGFLQRQRPKKQDNEDDKNQISEADFSTGTYGKPVGDPILGNYYKLPERTVHKQDFHLDTNFAYIPVYQHLIMPPPIGMQRPSTPPVVQQIRTLEKAKANRGQLGQSRSKGSLSIRSTASQRSKRSQASQARK